MKTKVCIDCEKEKDLDEFYDQTNPYVAKNPWSDGKRTECKICHNKKTRKNTLRIPVMERRMYMRNYMRTYKRKEC